MSEPILPLRQWPAGIQQASVPANDNALRLEAMSRPCLGVANDESGVDAYGDVWLVGSAPTGAFASFDENDIALYHEASWYAWAPVDGLRLVVDDVREVYVGGSTNEWEDDPSSGGGASSAYAIVTEATASTATVGVHDGLSRYVRAGGDVTFDDAQPYTAGMVFKIKATASLELIEDGVTLTPTYGGSLQLVADMGVEVVITSATTADVNGLTVAPP